MAPNDSAQTTEEDMEPRAGRRPAARYAVPVVVAGVAAATIGLVPALAATGDPELPKITAQELIEKIAASDTEQLSGSVKITTDLGLPSLGGLGGAAGSALAPTGGAGASGSTADPNARLLELASGTHTLRVAADGRDKQRVSIQDTAAEYSLIRNGDEVWAYDSASNEAYHAVSPKGGEKQDGKHGEKQDGKDGEKGTHQRAEGGPGAKGVPTMPQDFAEEALKAAADTTSVTVDGTSRIAGRDAYQLLVKPQQSGSTVGSIRIAVDAETGTPLKFTLTPSSGGKAVIDVGFTKVDFARPDASTFDFTPAKGTKVTQAEDHKAPRISEAETGSFVESAGQKIIGKGWNAVYELTTPVNVDVPSATDGLPAEAQSFLDALGDKATGAFGSGTVYKTRLVNALLTDDGKVYVGAVTKDVLVKAANEAK